MAWTLGLPTLIWWLALLLDHSLHWSTRSGPLSGWFLLTIIVALGGVPIFLIRWHIGARLALFTGYLIAMGVLLAVGGIYFGCVVYGDCP